MSVGAIQNFELISKWEVEKDFVIYVKRNIMTMPSSNFTLFSS